MRWTHSDVIALADQKCAKCLATGLMPGRHRDYTAPCGCVLREIFRICYRKFEHCQARPARMPSRSVESRLLVHKIGGPRRAQTLLNEEYSADFVLVAKRVLAGNEQQLAIFKFHFLMGASWEACCRRLQISRGEFFHEVYRLEEKLGRAFRELEPYRLFPVDEYFGRHASRRRAAGTSNPGAVSPAA